VGVLKVSGRNRSVALCALTLLLFFNALSTTHQSPSVPYPAPVRAQSTSSTAVVSIIPQNISDLSKGPGTTVVYNVTVASSPSISLFAVWVQFNPKILDASTIAITYTGNVLGSSAQVQSECINGASFVGVCQPYPLAGQGIVSLVLYNLGNQTTTFPTGGLLFQITLRVINLGFSQLHIIQAVLTNGVKVENYPATTVDGQFTNQLCGTTFCKHPFVDFTISPLEPVVGSSVTFNASISKATNANAALTTYTWYWGFTFGSESLQVVRFPVITHAFGQAQEYPITLTVNDTLGISWAITKTVHVIYVFTDLTFGHITQDHEFNIYPGTLITLSAQIINNSTVPTKGNLTMILDTGKVLANQSFSLPERSGTRYNSATLGPVTWDTTAYAPRVYRIEVRVIPTTPQNITTDKVGSAYVQLIVVQPTGLLSLGLLQTTGIGVLVLFALFAGLARFRKKPSYETEPL
jgi:PKD domain-containing protein